MVTCYKDWQQIAAKIMRIDINNEDAVMGCMRNPIICLGLILQIKELSVLIHSNSVVFYNHDIRAPLDLIDNILNILIEPNFNQLRGILCNAMQQAEQELFLERCNVTATLPNYSKINIFPAVLDCIKNKSTAFVEDLKQYLPDKYDKKAVYTKSILEECIENVHSMASNYTLIDACRENNLEIFNKLWEIDAVRNNDVADNNQASYRCVQTQ